MLRKALLHGGDGSGGISPIEYEIRQTLDNRVVREGGYLAPDANAKGNSTRCENRLSDVGQNTL